mgnify:CR=1 FL=1
MSTPLHAVSAAPVGDFALRCSGLQRYLGQGDGRVHVLKGVSFEARRGQVYAIVGPSGCGKTTLMRMLAGFETPSAGSISIAGQDLAGIPPHKRPVNMMFQSYALFPHMTVEKNIAFGLGAQPLTSLPMWGHYQLHSSTDS